MMRFKFLALTGLLSALAVGLPESARAGPTSGTLYYTTFSGGVNVHKVDFNYNGVNAFALSNNTGIASTPGADGLVFTSDGQLAVGGQGSAVYKVNPTTGSWTGESSGGPAAFHMMVGPDGRIYSSSIPGTPSVYNSTLTSPGTALTFGGGSTNVVDTISWSDSTHAFYTSSGSGGFGSFGRITLSGNSYTTSQIYSNLPAAHGMTYDSYTGDLILFGANHVTQIDPTTGAILGDATYSGTFDQGTSDGHGHIFVANNDGNLLFLDISNSHNVAAPDYATQVFLANSLDDVAPLSGFGSAAPEPSSVVLLATGVGLLGLRRLRRKPVAS